MWGCKEEDGDKAEGIIHIVLWGSRLTMDGLQERGGHNMCRVVGRHAGMVRDCIHLLVLYPLDLGGRPSDGYGYLVHADRL